MKDSRWVTDTGSDEDFGQLGSDDVVLVGGDRDDGEHNDDRGHGY